jgi:hypothetical protein
VDKVRVIALFESKSVRADTRDARLVNHMIELTRESGVQVEQINPVKLGVEAIPPRPKPKAKKPQSGK